MAKLLWRLGFLGVTVLAIGLELVAVLDGNADTEPWTHLITDYVPAEVAVAVFGALALWVPVHFYRAYKQRRRDDDSMGGEDS